MLPDTNMDSTQGTVVVIPHFPPKAQVKFMQGRVGIFLDFKEISVAYLKWKKSKAGLFLGGGVGQNNRNNWQVLFIHGRTEQAALLVLS